jgi:hypothetical protein
MLYLRDQELLSCFDVRGSSTATADAKFTDPERAKQAALKLFPELGVAGSPFNQAFVLKVQEARQKNAALLQDASWPLIIAKAVAAERK